MNKHLSTMLLLVFLPSCGSGSSSSSDSNNTQPIEYQFKLSAQQTNRCGQQVAFNQFELHLQDDNWQLIDKYTADANGQVSFATEQEYINYTIIAKYQQGAEEEGLDITSYHHANTTTSASYVATYDNLLDTSTCECVTQDIELQHRSFSVIDSVSSSFSYESWHSTDSQNTYFTNAEICRLIDDEWPIHSIAIRGLDTNNGAIGVASILNDFGSNTEGLWQSAAIEVADNVPLSSEHAAFNMMQEFANGEHFYVESSEDDTELLVFNTHPYTSESIHYARTSHIFDHLDTIFGQSTFASYHQIKSTMNDEATSVSAETEQPDIDYTNFSELAADGSYDYSAVSGYPLVDISFSYQVSSASITTPINWTMYGPIKGILASSVQLAGFEDTITPDTDIQNTEINIIKSLTTNNYDDYIYYYQGNTDSDFANDLQSFQLELVRNF
ncbi:hypothetical protein A9Q74_04845 [Colwellia sp. 39_35_sub15_T18]|nr:hypothetical protein A9Q74_04845 [Colwellia sp. 39_35_sub15_T18]